MGRKGKDLTGKRFGKLVVVRPAEVDKVGKRYKWICKCDCGNEVIVFGHNLGTTTISCGCENRRRSSERLRTHGQSKSRLFHVWQDMKQRCVHPQHHAYKNYGGRGITICDEWLDFSAFASWAHKNGYDENAPRGRCTLDRIDVNGNYEPSNCRWVNMDEQARNKRSNVLLSFDGQTHTIAEWSRITGLTHSTILCRVKRGWSAEKALTTPKLKFNTMG